MGRRLPVSVSASALIILALSLYIIPLRWIFAWYVAVVIHEAGHYLAVRLTGEHIISFQIRGHGCQIETMPLSDRKAIFCLLAGPIAGACTLLFARSIPRIAICALLQSLYNLLPIYPLDGGKIVKIIINRWRTQKYLAKI